MKKCPVCNGEGFEYFPMGIDIKNKDGSIEKLNGVKIMYCRKCGYKNKPTWK